MNKPSQKFLPHLIIMLFAFLLYGNTVMFDYALDDMMVARQNKFVEKGLAGIADIFSYDSFTGFFGKEKKLVAGGRYRPLSIATFAIEYQIFRGYSPALSHFLNILLYGFTGILIFILFRKLFPERQSLFPGIGIAFLSAMLFIAHPVHTEVVANIKGRDEILALLLSLWAALCFLKFFELKRVKWLVSSCILFFLALLSKENAIVFALLIPLMVLFFTKAPFRRIWPAGLSLMGIALLFVFIRFLVLGYLSSGKLPEELLNNPFLEANGSQKLGTIFYTLGLYLRLLIFPLTLTHDYYPYHIPLVPLGDLRSIIPLIIYTGLTGFGFYSLKSRSVAGFSVLIYLLPLFIVSNILFPVGTFMNERFIYISSLGFSLVCAWFFTRKLPAWIKDQGRALRIVIIIAGTALLLYSWRTITRNPVWHDNFSLFTRDVHISQNSIKNNIAAGGEWLKLADSVADSNQREAMVAKSVGYLEKAIRIYPRATNGYLLLGNALATHRKRPDLALEQYLTVLSYNPYDDNAFGNSLIVLNKMDNPGSTDLKIKSYGYLRALRPENAEANYYLGKLYGQYRQSYDTALMFLQEASRLAPENGSILKDLGIVYSMTGKYEQALNTFRKAVRLSPDDPALKQNIFITEQIIKSGRGARRGSGTE